MDDNKRATRSRRGLDKSTEDAAIDNDDKSSTSHISPGTVRSCKVMLRRANVDDFVEGPVASSTRGGRKSLLTEENVAAHSPAKRRLRSASMASDGTETTPASRPRSARLAAQNTPTRRSSRLLSGNEPTVDSPAKPGRRNLRSNSVVSDDKSPPRTRNTHLTESQSATPTLKTKVSKIKGESNSRRSSIRANRSVIVADVIDEDPAEGETDEITEMKIKDEPKEIEQMNSNDDIHPTEPTPMEVSVVADSHEESVSVPESSAVQEPNENVISMSQSPKNVSIRKSLDGSILSSGIEEMDVSILSKENVENKENSIKPKPYQIEKLKGNTASPKSPKNASPRKIMNDSIQSTGFDQMDVNLLAEEARNAEKTPKPARVQKLKKVLTPTPNKDPSEQNVDNDSIPSNVVDQMVEEARDAEKTPTPARVLKLKDGSTTTPKKHASPQKVMNESIQSTSFDQLNDSVLAKSPRVQKLKEVPTPNKDASVNDSIPSTGDDQMDVSILTEAANVAKTPQSTPNPPKNTSARKSMNEAKSLNESTKSFTPMKQVDKLESPISVAKSPQISESNVLPITRAENTPVTSIPQSKTVSMFDTPKNASTINLNSEINKLIVGLHTPVSTAESNRSFEDIANELSPQTNEQIDCQIDALASESNDASEEKCDDTEKVKSESLIEVSTETIKTDPDANVESCSKSRRKFVQIVTPKVNKTQSAEVRIDTPFPDSVTSGRSSANKRMNLSQELKASARADLNKLKESWNQSVKRNSLDGTQNAIDALGSESVIKTEDTNKKKSVVARNAWKNNLIESEEEILLDTEEEATDHDDDTDSDMETNEFIHDGAEEVENYQSGDSMDEDDRREIEENEIEVVGMDLGSEDTSDEYEEDEYEEDDFLVDDNAELSEEEVSDQESESSESHESIIVLPRRRIRQITLNSESDDIDDIDEAIANGNIIAVILPEDPVVVVQGNPPNADKIIEGKTFASTYFNKEMDEGAEQVKPREATVSEPTEVTSNENEIVNLAQGNNIDRSVSNVMPENDAVNTTASNENIPIETTTSSDQPTTSSEEPIQIENELQTTEDVPASNPEINENKLLHKKVILKSLRSSFSGINPLPKPSNDKKSSRVSLGDLNEKRRDSSVKMVESLRKNAPSFSIKKESFDSFINDSVAEQADMLFAQFVDSVDSNVNTQTDAIVEPTAQSSAIVTTNAEAESITAKGEANTSVTSGKTQSPKVATNSQLEEENNNKMLSAKKGTTVIESYSPETIEQQDEAQPSTSSQAQQVKQKKTKRIFSEVDNEDRNDEPRSKKLLKVISTASGGFLEEPVTPEKKNRGFKVTPLTPINANFRVENQRTTSYRFASKKRKSIYVDEEEADAMFLPKPRWQIKTQFEEQQPKKRARKLELGSTDVILRPLKTKKAQLIPVELAEFRQTRMYRPDIPRQDNRALLRQKYKRRANLE